MIRARFLAQSIFLSLLPALAALPVQAHPPDKVLLEFDAEEKTLQVDVDHASRKIDRHYVERLQLYVNGDLIETRRYDEQTDAEGLTEEFEIPRYRGREKVRVRVTCNRGGSESGYLKLPKRRDPKVESKDTGELRSIGAMAPDFALEDQSGRKFTLSDLRDETNVVLIFYSGDGSRGGMAMLLEAAGMSRVFAVCDAIVAGISPESKASHAEFLKDVASEIGKAETGRQLPDEILKAMRLPFNLLVDPGKRVSSAYGCSGFFGTKRTVYAIDKEGRIVLAKREMPSKAEIIEAFGISAEALSLAQGAASKEEESDGD